MFFNRKLKAAIAQLEQKVKIQEYHLERANEEHHRLVTKLKTRDLQIEALKNAKPEVIYGKRLVNLKFNALFSGRYQQTEFKTGLGPCGKTVTHFTVETDERHLTIHQHHTDGSHKEFIYRLSDIDGRIQKCVENVKLEGQEAKLEKISQTFIGGYRGPCDWLLK